MLSYPVRDTLAESPQDETPVSARTGIAVILGLSLSLWVTVGTLALRLF